MSKKREDSNVNVGAKKTFNKIKWREEKYSNKYKLKQWEERRRLSLSRKLQKEQRKDNKFNSVPNYNAFSEPDNNDTSTTDSNRSQQKKMSAYQRAQQEFNEKKEEKRRKREEIMRIQAERKQALDNYKRKKAERFIKLSKKTRKGQPVMKDRIELLLEKIQKDVYGT